MKRLALLLFLSAAVSCSSGSASTVGAPSYAGIDANEVSGEIAAPREIAFREVRGAIFRGGNIIAEEDAAAGRVRGDWRNVQQALPISVIRFVFTRHEDPQVSYQAQVTDMGGNRSRVVLTVRGRHLINRFFRQEWSQPYPLPHSEEIRGALQGYLDEARRNAEGSR